MSTPPFVASSKSLVHGSQTWLVRRALAMRDAMSADRGDVPGWVLITVMTAGLVTALWLVADGQLKAIFTHSVNGVTGP
jgi:hypothetical protein